ncbi:predicted protein [Uncinocarpus reesii 1704]|uniref:F-box domain-containing protein n=1 Tax=Uncinocarpus reesii (strain UAMH 1704) TaxID=336963 RepID=C4JM78_UNCRE|nr:uncharacterized protein UREG_03936 [Uncinocarpus reesii 1704]EEP79090.1 predicted protein [Uncinocarpus reesii 1704]
MDSDIARPASWAASFVAEKWAVLLLSVTLVALIVATILRSRKVSRKPSNHPPLTLFDMPLDVVLRVGDFLSTEDKMVFALSCKSAFVAFGDTRHSPEFKFPVKISPVVFPMERMLPFTSGYWQLLRRLEDSRFQCCSACLKLHPIREFSTNDLQTVAEERTCVLGPGAGVVYLCPCVQLTFRGGMKLEATIRRLARQRDPIIFEFGNESFYWRNWHSCQHTSGSGTLQIDLLAVVCGTNGLMIRSVYSFEPNANITFDPLARPDVPGYCCPHRSVAAHLLDSWGPRYEFKTTCRWCGTLIDTISRKSIVTVKYLRTTDHQPRSQWYYQTDRALENLDAAAQSFQWPERPWGFGS